MSHIRQHCCTCASRRLEPTWSRIARIDGGHHVVHAYGDMTAEVDLRLAPARGSVGCRWWSMLALLSALVTFLVLAGLTPIAPTHEVVVALLGVNALAVLLLLGIIGREIWQVVQARRRGRAGARLHVRIVGLFSVIAAAPAILVAVVGSITLDRGLDPGSVGAQALIDDTTAVANVYVLEHAAAASQRARWRWRSRCRPREAAVRPGPRPLPPFLIAQAVVARLCRPPCCSTATGKVLVEGRDQQAVRRLALPRRDRAAPTSATPSRASSRCPAAI